ncbi:MAG: hypothetical protein QM701_13080 [Propionivibrio sp.]
MHVKRTHAGDVGVAQAPDQVIGEVEEAPRGGVALGKVLLEPEDLGQLHLDADFAADVGQRGIVRGVERRRLRAGAVVHPHDDVALGLARLGDGNRLPAGADRHQRAGGVDADRGDARRVDRRGGDRFAHGGANLRPDVGGGLFDEQGFRVELPDRAHGKGQPPAVRIEQARAHAGRTDVDPQEYPIAHVYPRFLSANSS